MFDGNYRTIIKRKKIDNMKKNLCAIYTRVSTTEQDVEAQLLACRKYCDEHDYHIVDEYTDKKTGRNEKRKDFQRMLKDATYRRFDVLVLFKLDRLSRGTIREVINILDRLKSYNVQVISISEPYLNTSPDNPTSELILLIMSWCASVESKRISERVSSGITKWKADHPNKRWCGKDWDIDKALSMRKQGASWRTIEREINKDGHIITMQGIRKELLKRGCEKCVNLPSKKKAPSDTCQEPPTMLGVKIED
jgi:DNA invertase Pin-like site-specific DNA recombinase